MMALGGSLPIATPGDPHTLDIPEGTQSGATFRVRGKGMPNVGGRGHGDLFVSLRVAVPKKLTKEQRKAVEALLHVITRRAKRYVTSSGTSMVPFDVAQ